MRPIHDIDVVILMATALASKRRPAELIEIVAAADLLQGVVPFVEKLDGAIQRLTKAGLIQATDGGFTLTAVAQDIVAQQPKKATTEDLVSAMKSSIAAYAPNGEYPVIELGNAVLSAAIQAHKVSKKASGKNLLMPKPKPARHFKVDGRWRRAPASR